MAAVQDFSKMKVTELKKALKEKGLSMTGSKSELLDRLTTSVESEEATAETSITEDSILDDNVDLTEPSPPPKPATKPTEPTLKKITSPESNKEDGEKKVAVTAAGNSESERLKKRAERFGVVNEDMKKQLRAERFGGNAATPNSKLSTAGSGASTDVLKKRAERFGQVLSPSLSKVDEAEKLQKRKDRFGDLTAATNNGPSKKLKVNAGSADDEKLKKRAERFGLS